MASPVGEAAGATPTAGRALADVAFDAFNAVVLMVVVGVVAAAMWLAFSAGDRLPSLASGEGLPVLVLSVASTGGAALILHMLRGRRIDVGAPVASVAAAWRWGLGGGLMAWLGVLSAQWVMSLASGTVVQPTNMAPLEAVRDASPVMLFAFTVVLAPVIEELLFRRLLFARLWAAGRPGLGILLSSALFASMHEIPGAGAWHESLVAWCLYLGMGALFALVYWRTGRLWAAILAHAVNNLLATMGLLVAVA